MKPIRTGSFLMCLVLFGLILTWAYLETRWIAWRAKDPRAARVLICRRIARWGDFAFRVVCVGMRIRLTLDLPERKAHAPPVVHISNHTSVFDVLANLAVAHRLGYGMRWIVKQEVFKYPLIGRMARESGCFGIARNGSQSDRDAVEFCALMARDDGDSVLIFPEGTRGPDLLQPKPGGFIRSQRVIPDVVSVTLGWYPVLGQGGRGKLLSEGADLVGRRILLQAIYVPPKQAGLDGWIDAEWTRKRVVIKDWRRAMDAEAYYDRSHA